MSGRRSLLPAVGILFLVFLVLIQLLATRHLFLGAAYPEFFPQWFLYRNFFRSVYRDGFFPLWSHNLFAGFPLASFPHAGAFYPLQAVFYLLSYHRGSIIYFLTHLWLAGMFVYALAREWEISPVCSWLGAVGFMFCGTNFLLATVSDSHFATIVWMTGFYWSSYRLFHRGNVTSFLASAGTLAAAVLAGSFEIVAYGLISLLILVVASERGAWRRTPLWGLAILAGLEISSIQFMLTAGFLVKSFRSSYPVTIPGHLINDLGPVFLLYSMGFLLLLGLVVSPPEDPGRKRRRVLLAMLLFYTLVILGLPPFHGIFRLLPVIGNFSSPDTCLRLILSVMGLTFAVSAQGLQTLLSGVEGKDLRRVEWFIAIYGFCLLAMIADQIFKWSGLPWINASMLEGLSATGQPAPGSARPG